MKKYTIKDNLGNKKTIYAEDVAHAMTFVDSKLKDVNLTNGDWFTLRNDYNATIYKIISVSHDVYVTDVYSVEVDFDAKKSFIRKVGSKSFHTSNIKGRDDITTLAVKFNSAEEAMNWLKRQNRLTSNLFKQHDSKLKDETYNSEYSIQQFKSYVSNIIKDLYGIEYNSDKVRAISKLDAYVSQVIDDFKADIKNSNLDKRKTVQYYMQYVNALYKELINVKNVQNIDGQSLKKIDDIHAKMARSIHDSKLEDAVSLIKGDWFTLRRHNDVVYKVVDDQRKPINGFSGSMIVETYRITFTNDYEDYTIKKVGNESFRPDKWSSPDIVKFNSAEEAINWLRRQLRLKKHEFDSKVKDEASLATTLNALIDDEKAAIDAYDVAIKNLEGKIDEDAKQVIINIRDDERRHIENLYAILNGQVTEKNLEDSKTANEAER